MERECKIHGVHSSWRHKSGKGWICRLCRQSERRAKRIARNYQILATEYGEDIARQYAEAARKRNVHINEFRGVGRRQPFGEQFSGADRHVIHRIELLNLAANKPVHNLGWNCSVCGVYHDEYAFFDVDRIVPGSQGGEYVAGNIRVLCPNCHKCKSNGLRDWRG